MANSDASTTPLVDEVADLQWDATDGETAEAAKAPEADTAKASKKSTRSTKTGTSKTAKKASTKAQESKADASADGEVGLMDLMPDLSERQYYMVLTVLLQKCGSYYARQARVNDTAFDWKIFGENFRAQYGNRSLEELLRFAKTKFGLATMDEIRAEFQAHCAKRQENYNRRYNTSRFQNTSFRTRGTRAEPTAEDGVVEEMDVL